MATSNKAAKRIKAGIGSRVRDKNDEGSVYGVPLYVPPSKPKASLPPPPRIIKGKPTYR